MYMYVCMYVCILAMILYNYISMHILICRCATSKACWCTSAPFPSIPSTFNANFPWSKSPYKPTPTTVVTSTRQIVTHRGCLLPDHLPPPLLLQQLAAVAAVPSLLMPPPPPRAVGVVVTL